MNSTNLKRFAILCAAGSIILGAQSGSAPTLATPTKTEWVLNQIGQDTGAHTVYATPDAVKIVSNAQGYIVLAKAPEWQVYCYRPAEKKYWRGELKDFCGTIVINPFALPKLNENKLKKLPDVTYCGVPAAVYRPLAFRSFVYITARSIPTSEKAAEFLCRYFCTPKINQIPLMRKYDTSILAEAAPQADKEKAGWVKFDLNMAHDLRTGPKVLMETKAVKEQTYNAGDFVMPSGMTRIKEINQIGVSSSNQEQVNDMLGEIGFTSEDKKKTKKP